MRRKKPCYICQETDCITVANYKNVGADLRLDVENKQFDIQLGFNGSWKNINFGKRL